MNTFNLKKVFLFLLTIGFFVGCQKEEPNLNLKEQPASQVQPVVKIQKALELSEAEAKWLEKNEHYLNEFSKTLDDGYLKDQKFKEYCKEVVFLLSKGKKEEIPKLLEKTFSSEKGTRELSTRGGYSGRFGRLTWKEKKLVLRYPNKAYFVYQHSRTADNITTNRFYHLPLLNSKADAFRHALWSALLARDIGAYYAKLFTDAHESETLPRHALEKQMDLHNNAIGYSTGYSYDGLTMANKIEEKMHSGELVYLYPIDYTKYGALGSKFWNDPTIYGSDDGHHGITDETRVIPTNR